jgi:hypothetical protein
MKKLLLILTFLTFLGCNKENITPTPECNCGTISDYGTKNGLYWIELENDCSGNKEHWFFREEVFITAQIGYNLCMYDEPNW